jgi:hypothetical protein
MGRKDPECVGIVEWEGIRVGCTEIGIRQHF